jgi:hypothetical protein
MGLLIPQMNNDYTPTAADGEYIRWLYTQDWLKLEMSAGRYRDPGMELSDMLLDLGEDPDPTVTRPSLSEVPSEQVSLPSGQVYISDAERRYCVRVGEARAAYKAAHYDEMMRWIEARPKVEYVPTQPGESLRTLEQSIADNDQEIQALYQQYEPPELDIENEL